MKLIFDVRLIPLWLIVALAPIIFITALARTPTVNVAAPAAVQASPTPCPSPNPVSKFASNPAVVEVDTTNDIYAVGDPHADPARLAGVLLTAKIIGSIPATPSAVTWTAGNAVVVFTGDMIDKGPDSLGVIALLRALQTAAAAQGGRVIITMGNHEAEFLADPHGDKTDEFGKELKKAGLKRNDVAGCQGDLGVFLCGLPIAARVNDWFFSHAGNTNGQSIPQLNAAIAAGICQDGFTTKQLIGDNSILEARLNSKGPGGLPWFDNGSSKTNPQTLLQSYVTALGVNHLVQGHQPGKVSFPDGVTRSDYNIFQRYGLLFLNDSGISQGISGNDSIGGALHFAMSTPAGSSTAVWTVNAICAGGQTIELWDSTTKPTGPLALACPSPTPTPSPKRKL
jgi:hypothetical protein